MGDFMVPVSQNEQSGEIINTNPSQTGHTTLPLPERIQNQALFGVLMSTVVIFREFPTRISFFSKDFCFDFV